MERSGHAVVIEDERDVLDLLSGHLDRLGYRVTGAQTGERGVALALSEPPDVVVVDFLLPDMDGREVVRRLRGDARTAPCAIVLCSVLDATDFADVPADAVLAKPFGKAAVAELVRRLAERRSVNGPPTVGRHRQADRAQADRAQAGRGPRTGGPAGADGGEQ